MIKWQEKKEGSREFQISRKLAGKKLQVTGSKRPVTASKKMQIIGNKKAQITFFLIIAVVGILLFIFIYMLQKDSSAASTTSEVDVLNVKNYMDNCVHQTLKEAVKIAGAQGGFIYDYQNGSIKCCPINMIVTRNDGLDYNVEMKTVPVGKYNVSFSIYSPDTPSPRYPDPVTNLGHAIYTDTYKDYLPGFFSLQTQMQHYVKNMTQYCLKDVEEVFNESYDFVIVGNASLNLTLGYYDVKLDLDVPIVLGKNGNVKTLRQFSTKMDTRLGLIHEMLFKDNPLVLSKSIVSRDITQADFNLDLFTLPEKFEGLQIGAFSQDTFDIITVIDTRFLMDGEPYVYQTARENRPPVVMPQSTANVASKDLYVGEGGNITLNATVFDPDEDILNIQIEGYGNTYCNSAPRVGDLVDCNKWKVTKSGVYYYETNHADVLGNGAIDINATDPGGKSDWDTLTLKINDYPMPDLDTGYVTNDFCKDVYTVNPGYQNNGIAEFELWAYANDSVGATTDPADYTYTLHCGSYSESKTGSELRGTTFATSRKRGKFAVEIPWQGYFDSVDCSLNVIDGDLSGSISKTINICDSRCGQEVEQSSLSSWTRGYSPRKCYNCQGSQVDCPT